MPRLTRRRALELAGAATAAAAAWRPATASAASFTQDVPLPHGATISGKRTLAPVRAPRPFELIGLDFGPAAHVHAELRARRGGGHWSRWTPVHDATQPVWTGRADTYQVRFTGAARRLTARFVDVAARPRAVTAAKRATAGQPDIIGRSEWGGDGLKRKHAPTYGTVSLGFVHHTVTANAYAPEDSAGIVLGIARYHRDHNGWWDIGYQFLVDRYGQIFEGREGGVELAVIGAQAQGYNSVSTGVSCLGDFTAGPLPAAGAEAVAQLLAWKLSLHGVPCLGKVTVTSQGGETNRYGAGRKVTLNRISGHRDGDATSCPGEALYKQLPGIRARADQLAESVSALTVGAALTETQYPDTTVELTGVLRFDDDADATGVPVDLQYQTAAYEPWTTLGQALADPGGAFSASVALPASGRVRGVYNGDGVHPPLRSTPLPITVKPALTLVVDPKRLRAGRLTDVSGTISAPVPVTKGTLLVERRVRGIFYRTVKRQVSVTDGAFATRFKPPVKGLYRVTFSTGGATVHRWLRAL